MLICGSCVLAYGLVFQSEDASPRAGYLKGVIMDAYGKSIPNAQFLVKVIGPNLCSGQQIMLYMSDVHRIGQYLSRIPPDGKYSV